MDWMKLLQQVFELCLFPIVGALAGYAVMLIRKKQAEIEASLKSDKAKKYVKMLSDTISECVIATNQTYVEALKEKNIFDADAQAQAFQLTFDAVKSIVSEDVVSYLSEFYGDVDALIKSKIEAEVNYNK